MKTNKKIIPAVVGLLCIVVALLIVLTLRTGTPQTGISDEGYVISSMDEVGMSYDPHEMRSQYLEVSLNTIEELSTYCNAIVKAQLTEIGESSYATGVYTFNVVTDFMGTAEETIHVHADKSSFYEIGGVYYLFLSYWDSPLYPHRVYNLGSGNFLVREYLLNGELVYDFRDDEFCLDVGKVTDMAQYMHDTLASESINGSRSITTDRPVTLSDAIEQSNLVMCVTVTSLTEENKYVSSANFAIDDVLSGAPPEDAYGASIPVAAGSSIGDRYILLYTMSDDGIVGVASYDYNVLPMNSEEAAAVLKYYGVSD